MSRPKKSRHVCALPEQVEFGPRRGQRKNGTPIVMTVDEYEAIRLIDFEGLNQIQCAEHMKVARTTGQKIYNQGKHKLADALINGKHLRIEGGDFELCNREREGRYCGQCQREAQGEKEE